MAHIRTNEGMGAAVFTPLNILKLNELAALLQAAWESDSIFGGLK
jgi:hypothetical protein